MRERSLPTFGANATAWKHRYMSMASPTVEWKCD
jgi:hypothetical protein